MNLAKKIHIIGVGNNTAVYVDLAEACGFEVAGLYHYESSRVGEVYFGHKIRGTHDDIISSIGLNKTYFAISIGDNKKRQIIANRIRENNGLLPTLIHPNACVSRYAQIEESVVVHAGAVIQAGVHVGRDSVISFRAGITHTTSIREACYIAGGATVGAYITVERLAFVGMGSTLVSGKVARIGECATIGAGSLVLNDVESYQVVAGVPAKPLK